MRSFNSNYKLQNKWREIFREQHCHLWYQNLLEINKIYSGQKTIIKSLQYFAFKL